MPPSRRTGWGMAGRCWCPRSPAWTRRRSGAARRKWPGRWPTRRSSGGSAARGRAAAGRKKDPAIVDGVGGVGRAGHGRRPDERAEVGPRQPAAPEPRVGSGRAPGEPADGAVGCWMRKGIGCMPTPSNSSRARRIPTGISSSSTSRSSGRRFSAAGLPEISVDTKKKELIGQFKNAGRVWSQEAEAVNVHDFRHGRAGPGGPLRHLRPDPQPGHRLRRPVGGHAPVRGRSARPLVGRRGAGGVPRARASC